jgi:chromosome segregation ATPase
MEDSVTKLRKSPEGNARAELAAAIKASKSAHTAVSKQKQAVQKLFSEMVAAENQIPAAEKAVAKAENEYIAAVAESAASGLPEPVNGKAEAEARLVLTKDRVNVLREARRRLESEIPDWQQDADACDVECERLISLIISDHLRILIAEAEELARRLAPYRSALMAFVRDHGDRPSQWDKQSAWDKSREPLNESAALVWAFFRELREATAPSPCWKTIRARLREDPNAAILRPLVAEFDGLLAKDPDEPRPEPA